MKARTWMNNYIPKEFKKLSSKDAPITYELWLRKGPQGTPKYVWSSIEHRVLVMLKWLYAILAHSQNLQHPATLADTYLQI